MSHPRRQPLRPITPDETDQFAKMYVKISSRRDLRDNEKALLYVLLDLQKKEGFAFASWENYAARLGKNKKNAKRAFQKLEARYPGLFLVRKFRRKPSHIVVNLDALDGQPHLQFPGADPADCVVPDGGAPGGAGAPSAGGADGGARAPTLGAHAPLDLGAHAPPYQSIGNRLMNSGGGGAPNVHQQPTLFGGIPIWFDAKTANGKASAERPLTQVYVDCWRAGAFRFVLMGGRRFITNASCDDEHLFLDVWAEDQSRTTTTERLTINASALFAGHIKFGAPG